MRAMNQTTNEPIDWQRKGNTTISSRPVVVTATHPVNSSTRNELFPSVKEVKQELQELKSTIPTAFKEIITMATGMGLQLKASTSLGPLTSMEWRQCRKKADELNTIHLLCVEHVKASSSDPSKPHFQQWPKAGRIVDGLCKAMNRLPVLLLEEYQEPDSNEEVALLLLQFFQEQEIEELIYRRLKLCEARKVKELKIVAGCVKHSKTNPALYPKLLNLFHLSPTIGQATKKSDPLVRFKASSFVSFLKPLNLQVIERHDFHGFLRVRLSY